MPDLAVVCTQELAAGLKGEVRALLGAHGVGSFVLKPVRRSYAFELDAVPRGEQWVLKARYPSVQPPLPLGLTGDFTAPLQWAMSLLTSMDIPNHMFYLPGLTGLPSLPLSLGFPTSSCPEQWVLKALYSAAQPPPPLGLTGLPTERHLFPSSHAVSALCLLANCQVPQAAGNLGCDAALRRPC